MKNKPTETTKKNKKGPKWVFCFLRQDLRSFSLTLFHSLILFIAVVSIPAPARAISGTAKHIIVESATAAELDTTVLTNGILVYRDDDPKDLRLGDGHTLGGICLWNFAALTNPPGVYDRDLQMDSYAVRLNPTLSIGGEGGLFYLRSSSNNVFTVVGGAGGSSITNPIVSYAPAGTNQIRLTVLNRVGSPAPTISVCSTLTNQVWTSASYTLTRLTDNLIECLITAQTSGPQYYLVEQAEVPVGAVFYVPLEVPSLTVAGAPALTQEADSLFTNSPAFTITTNHIANWLAAFSWGNHALAGYVTNALHNFVVNGKTGTVSGSTSSLTLAAADVGALSTNGGRMATAAEIHFDQNGVIDGLDYISGWNGRIDFEEEHISGMAINLSGNSISNGSFIGNAIGLTNLPWGQATTNSMTNINWGALGGGGGATNLQGVLALGSAATNTGLSIGSTNTVTAKFYLKGESGIFTNKPLCVMDRSTIASTNIQEWRTNGTLVAWVDMNGNIGGTANFMTGCPIGALPTIGGTVTGSVLITNGSLTVSGVISATKLTNSAGLWGTSPSGAVGQEVRIQGGKGGAPYQGGRVVLSGGVNYLGNMWEPVEVETDLIADMALSVQSNLSINGGSTFAANTTNRFIRQDGKTNAIYCDINSKMYISADGGSSIVLSTNGTVGIGGGPSASYQLYVTGSGYYTAQLRASSLVDTGGGNVDPSGSSLFSNLTTTGTLIFTNLPTSTNGLVPGTLWRDGENIKIKL